MKYYKKSTILNKNWIKLNKTKYNKIEQNNVKNIKKNKI